MYAKKKKSQKRRHIPQRMCIGCHEVGPKQKLIRIVNGPGGVQIDPTGRSPGRGAYLHSRLECWEAALRRGALAQALRVEMTPELRELLMTQMNDLENQKND